MSEQHEPDIRPTWTLRRGSGVGHTRFHLNAEVTAEFVEPTRDEVRDALMQILDEALGPDQMVNEIAGWQPLSGGESTIGVWGPIKESHADSLAAIVELEQLRAWKAEALPLLETLDDCHDALPAGDRAPLGHSKAQAVYDFIFRHTDGD